MTDDQAWTGEAPSPFDRSIVISMWLAGSPKRPIKHQ
jgi:hypothetical protein